MFSSYKKSAFAVVLTTEMVDSGVKSRTGYSNLLLLMLFSRPVFSNSADGIIHIATWMHLDGTAPQAVRRAPGCLCVPKEFLEHAAGEWDTPPAAAFFFFLHFFFTSLCLCSTPNPSQNHLVPPFSTLSRPSFGNCCVKRQDCLLETNFYPRAWRIVLSGDGVMDVSSILCLGGWGGSTFCIESYI